MYIYIYVYIYVCVYMYIYIYTYIHTYIKEYNITWHNITLHSYIHTYISYHTTPCHAIPYQHTLHYITLHCITLHYITLHTHAYIYILCVWVSVCSSKTFIKIQFFMVFSPPWKPSLGHAQHTRALSSRADLVVLRVRFVVRGIFHDLTLLSERWRAVHHLLASLTPVRNVRSYQKTMKGAINASISNQIHVYACTCIYICVCMCVCV